MRADLDTLLTDAARAPGALPDADAIWAGGRRRRALRRVSTAGGGLAGIAALALVASGVLAGAGTAVPEIEPMGPPAGVDGGADVDADGDIDDGDIDDGDAPDTAEESTDTPTSESVAPSESSDASESLDARAERELIESTTPRGEWSVSTESEAPDEPVQAATPPPPSPAPTPDTARSADPCAVHQDGEMRSFLDVVAPVAGQQASGAVQLIGCSSVPEGTVRYRLSQDGTVVADGFTTASAGGPGIGEFRESIALPASGRVTLEVFWDSPAGDGARDLGSITFDVG